VHADAPSSQAAAATSAAYWRAAGMTYLKACGGHLSRGCDLG
jgi:hypothetical protein